jgi:hypothetical protein
MLPGRLGLRFALEALFLVVLAICAGLAGLDPLWIVLVMAIAWVLVALIEFTAERIASSPITYLLPQRTEVASEDEPERVFWPQPEERTVVAPPERPAEPEAEEEAEPEPEPLPAAADEPEPDREEASLEPPLRQRLRSFLRRKEPQTEPEPPSQPRHVKLLPRRSAPESTRAAQEVAELFGETEREERGA